MPQIFNKKNSQTPSTTLLQGYPRAWYVLFDEKKEKPPLYFTFLWLLGAIGPRPRHNVDF